MSLREVLSRYPKHSLSFLRLAGKTGRSISRYPKGAENFPSPMVQEFLLSAKTLGTFNEIFFYVGLPGNVGISYAFSSTKSARKSLGAEIR